MASYLAIGLGVPTSIKLFASHLLLSTSVIGFSRADSWVRTAAFPLVSCCVYGIITKAPEEMRTRWTGLVGGLAFLSYLQYIDVALLSRWSYETHNSKRRTEDMAKQAGEESNGSGSRVAANYGRKGTEDSVWARFSFGLNTMLSLRHVNTPYEVRGVAPFSKRDPSYIPSRSDFLLKRALSTALCYLTLDLMDAKPAPTNVGKLFDPAVIPFFGRLGEVTSDELKLRVFSVVGFTVTFYCITQGFYSMISVPAVGSGLSNAADWKPMFGSLSDACSLRGFWGKYWHQCLRQPITSPAIWLSENVFRIPRKSLAHRYAPLVFAFIVSAVMHTAANLSSGEGRVHLGVLQFFCTQAAGIVVEDQMKAAYQRFFAAKEQSSLAKLLCRSLGYIWVTTFAIWSAPVWIYPIARMPAKQGPPSLLPYSIIKAVKRSI